MKDLIIEKNSSIGDRTNTYSNISNESLLQTIIKSKLSPKEKIGKLSDFGIESYLTDCGDLCVKCWAIAARNFASVDDVPALRENMKKPKEAAVLEWVSRNLSEFDRQYAGKWIAIVQEQVVASSNDLSGLLDEITRLDIQEPFITEIPTETTVWQTAYAIY